MNENAESMLHLPGTAEEQNWLREHLEVLGVREGIILAAAMQRSPPAAMADAVNHVLTLDDYDVCPANSYEALGEFYLWDNRVPEDQRQFFDKTGLGQWYEEKRPGAFIGNCYVVYPQNDRAPYDGQRLPADIEHPGWSVRLKLASESVPEGVWIKLPAYCRGDEDYPDEIQMALDKLRVKKFDECILREDRCVLPGIVDNTQDTIFGGFAPQSQTAEALSKSLGSRTVMSGSVSKGKSDSNRSLQMMERPLLYCQVMNLIFQKMQHL